MKDNMKKKQNELSRKDSTFIASELEIFLNEIGIDDFDIDEMLSDAKKKAIAKRKIN